MASNKTTMGGNISEPFDGHHKARDRFFGTAELLLELAEAVSLCLGTLASAKHDTDFLG